MNLALGSPERSTPNHFLPMSNAESSDSPQVKFILELCQAFSKKDIDFVAKNLHKDYRRNTYPRSLGKQDQTKEEWLEEFGGVLDLWAKNEVGCHKYPLRRG